MELVQSFILAAILAEAIVESISRLIIDGNTWSPVDYPQGWELVE